MIDVGVVMPVYKQKPAFLEAALQSVLKQTYAKFKLVIVIDGAPDGAAGPAVRKRRPPDGGDLASFQSRRRRSVECGIQASAALLRHQVLDVGVQR